jgi:hypothetical protein
MNEISTTLSDFALCALNIIFCWKLWALRVSRKNFKNNFFGIFAAAALASLMGGVVHGFLPADDEKITQFFWLITMISVGVSSYNLNLVNLHLLFRNEMVISIRKYIRILLAIYIVIVIWVSSQFYIAIISYIPAAIVLFLILFSRVMRKRTMANLGGLVGLGLTFVAAYIQQSHLAIHPVYMDHNALYHVLQSLGMAGLFIFARRASVEN